MRYLYFILFHCSFTVLDLFLVTLLAKTKGNCSFFLLNPISILKSCGNDLFMNQEFNIQEDIAPPLFCQRIFSKNKLNYLN